MTTTTLVTRVCRVCGGDPQPITQYRQVYRIDAKGEKRFYHVTRCNTCYNSKERGRYASEKARAALAVHCRVCTIVLREGGLADNDLEDSVAHGHKGRCCACSSREPLVDTEVLVPARGEMAVLMFPDYWSGKTG